MEQAEALASFALGLTSEQPETIALGLDPDRTRGFVSRFLKSHNLEIRAMTEDTTDPTAPAAVEEKKEDTQPAAEVSASNGGDLKQFYERFGDKGAIWCAQGLSFEQAERKFFEEQEARIADLEKKLAAKGIAS